MNKVFSNRGLKNLRKAKNPKSDAVYTSAITSGDFGCVYSGDDYGLLGYSSDIIENGDDGESILITPLDIERYTTSTYSVAPLETRIDADGHTWIRIN